MCTEELWQFASFILINSISLPQTHFLCPTSILSFLLSICLRSISGIMRDLPSGLVRPKIPVPHLAFLLPWHCCLAWLPYEL